MTYLFIYIYIKSLWVNWRINFNWSIFNMMFKIEVTLFSYNLTGYTFFCLIIKILMFFEILYQTGENYQKVFFGKEFLLWKLFFNVTILNLRISIRKYRYKTMIFLWVSTTFYIIFSINFIQCFHLLYPLLIILTFKGASI